MRLLQGRRVLQKSRLIMRKSTIENIEIYKKMADWVNINDCFWLSDLKAVFGSMHHEDKIAYLSGKFIGKLKDYGYVQCSEVKNGNRQYILLRKVSFESLSFK